MIRLAPFALVAAVSSPAYAATTPAVLADRMLAAITAKDLAAVIADTADDATLTLQFAPDAPIALKGKAAVRAYFETFFSRYKSIALTNVVKTPAADGRSITVETMGTFETPAGDRHSVGYVWVITANGGKIVASRAYILPLPPAVAR